MLLAPCISWPSAAIEYGHYKIGRISTVCAFSVYSNDEKCKSINMFQTSFLQNYSACKRLMECCFYFLWNSIHIKRHPIVFYWFCETMAEQYSVCKVDIEAQVWGSSKSRPRFLLLFISNDDHQFDLSHGDICPNMTPELMIFNP